MRCFLLAATLAVLVLAGEAGAQSRQPPEQPRAEKQSAADKRGTPDQPLVVDIMPPKPDAEQSAKEDREAARQAAVDDRMYWITAILAFIAALQVFLAGLAWFTSRAQLRAYVLASEAMIQNVTGSGAVRLFVTLKNFGPTPAREVVNRFSTRQRPPDFKDFVHPDLAVLSKSTMGPGGVLTSDSIITRDVWNQCVAHIQDGNLVQFVFGTADYVDVFGRPHTTRYRFRLDVSGGLRNEDHLVPCDEGNEDN